MIPCREGCSHYCEGCHKTCSTWQQLRTKLSEDRTRRDNYLRREAELSRVMLRQFRAMGGRDTVHR